MEPRYQTVAQMYVRLQSMIRQRADTGFRRAAAEAVLQPANPFEPQKKRLPKQGVSIGIATGAQLFEFMKCENCEYSREAFYHRLRRLVGRGLVKKGDGLTQPVYWISELGASFLVGQGEPYAGRSGTEMAKRNFLHWLELNDVHLALRKSGILVQ